MDILFHKVSEKEKKQIQKQAKEIIDSFSKKLSKISGDLDESLIVRDDEERRESEGKTSEDFSREIMFKNAPKKNKDFVVAEKGGW